MQLKWRLTDKFECAGKSCEVHSVDLFDWEQNIDPSIRAVITPEHTLKFGRLAEQNDIYPQSDKISVWTLETLSSIDKLIELENIIFRCFDIGIKFIVDVSIDDIPYYKKDHINNCFKSIEHILNTGLIKILTSVPFDRLCVDKKYHKHFIYFNYWAYHTVYNFNEWGTPSAGGKNRRSSFAKLIRSKPYKFSWMIGRVFRSPRPHLLTELYRKNIVSDKFFLCAEPFLLEVLSILGYASYLPSQRRNLGVEYLPKYQLSPSDNIIYNEIIQILLTSNLQVNESIDPQFCYDHIIDKQPSLKYLPDVSKKYLSENFNKVLFSHPFVDSESKPTTILESEHWYTNQRKSSDLYYSHWDKIIPTAFYKSWINILCEGGDPYFSEKTYKPIFAGIPFLSLYGVDFSEMFTGLGFELYNDLFDYSYTHQTGHNNFETRVESVVNQLELLNNDKHLESLMIDQIPVIEHNQNHLKHITKDFSFISQI